LEALRFPGMSAGPEEFGPPERVYVEIEWYDGPRAGVADIDGVPHRFKSLFDEADDDYLGTFLVWPIDATALELEIEQWRIFVAWNASYESGAASVETHPGHGGVDRRWDEIEAKLRASRESAPPDARRARAAVESIDREARYEPRGPDYMLRWRIL
jgi:hypothetical protein